MTDWLPNKFVNVDGQELGKECVEGYDLIMVLYTASWWGGCKPFKASLKGLYEKWNADSKKIQVVVVSGDSDSNGFNASMEGAPWVAVPLNGEKGDIEAKVPCTGYPTPGVINGKTGDVINADVFGKVEEGSLAEWLAACWNSNNQNSSKLDKSNLSLWTVADTDDDSRLTKPRGRFSSRLAHAVFALQAPSVCLILDPLRIKFVYLHSYFLKSATYRPTLASVICWAGPYKNFKLPASSTILILRNWNFLKQWVYPFFS